MFATTPEAHWLHFQQSGQGPDLVFVHGLAANLAFWHMRVAPALALDHRVTSFDLRGHGRSKMTKKGYTTQDLANDLQCVLDAAQIDRADIVAHSFGGAVALQHALMHQDRVRSLSLIDARVHSLQPLHCRNDISYWEQRRKEIEAQGIPLSETMPRVVYMMLEELAPLAAQGVEGPRLAPGLPLSNGMWNPNSRTARCWNELVSTTSFAYDICTPAGLTAERICHLNKPVLLSYGGDSYCLDTCRELETLLDDADKVIHPGLGHFFPLVKPELVVQDVRRFLEKLHLREMSQPVPITETSRESSEHRR
jgi:pimeloyl-ACP methyl ester carboxylesterase